MQTLEAIVDETGKISLLEVMRLEKSHRALVTILDEEPKTAATSKKENLRGVFGEMRKVEMFRAIENMSDWQKNLRDGEIRLFQIVTNDKVVVHFDRIIRIEQLLNCLKVSLE